MLPQIIDNVKSLAFSVVKVFTLGNILASYPDLQPWKEKNFFHSCEKSCEGRPGDEARNILVTGVERRGTGVYCMCACPPLNSSVPRLALEPTITGSCHETSKYLSDVRYY